MNELISFVCLYRIFWRKSTTKTEQRASFCLFFCLYSGWNEENMRFFGLSAAKTLPLQACPNGKSLSDARHKDITKPQTNMDNQKKPQENGLQIELTPQVAEGKYTNLALLSHSHAEFIMDFARVMPGMPKAPVVSRLILAPEHAKRLLIALQDNIMKYERQFGAIVLPEQQGGGGRTATPFGMPEGQA